LDGPPSHEDVVLALFEPLEDDGPVVLVFFAIGDRQNTRSLNVVKRLQNPKTEQAIGEMKNSLAGTVSMIDDIILCPYLPIFGLFNNIIFFNLFSLLL